MALFDADRAGDYVVSASAAPENDATLAVGEDLANVIPTLLLALALLLLSLTIGVVIAGVTFTRRSRTGSQVDPS